MTQQSTQIARFDEFEQTDVFDGFCHRQWNESLDGWRRSQIQPGEFPVLEMAHQIIDMAAEINRLRRQVWELQQEKKMRDDMWRGGLLT